MKQIKYGLNVIGLLAVLLMITAMFMPWWSFAIEGTGTTQIYPYLVDGPASEFVGYKRSIQMTLLTGFLIVCILLGLAGTFLSGRLSRILMAVSGAGVLLGSWRLVARLQGVASRWEIPLQGQGYAQEEGFAMIKVWARIDPGLYLVVFSGVLILLASVLHRRVRVREWETGA